MAHWLAVIFLQLALASSTSSQEAAVQNIQKVQEALQAMGMNGSITQCDPSSAKPECTFANFCGQIVQNRKSAYVYQDSSGRKVANYNLLFLQQNLDICLAANGKPQREPALAEQDPFVNPRLLYGPTGPKFDQLFAKEDQRARGVALGVQKRMVDMLKSKRNTQNGKAIDNMISRIEKVKWTSFRPKNEEELFENACSLPNAFFSPNRNEIVVCPQMLGMPDATLEMVFAHELAHTIDTCYSSMTLSDDRGIMKLSDPNWAMGKPLVEAIPASQNPYAKAIQCLQSPGSMGRKVRSNEDKIQDLKEYLAGLDEEGADPENPEIQKIQAALRDLEEAREENLCPKGEEDKNANYLQENFADWMAAQVVSERLKEEKDPAKAKAIAFETQALGLQAECPGFAEDQKAHISKQMKDAGCSNKSVAAVNALFEVDKSEGGNEHPGWVERSGKIFMAEPEIQKALSCQPKKDVTVCR